MKFIFVLSTFLFAAPAAAQDCDPADNSGVMVFGGTGNLGSYHVKQLSTAGERVIVFARATSSYERIEGADYEVVIGDLTEPDTVMAGVMKAKPAVIIDASNYPGIRFDDGQTFYFPAMTAIVQAAKVTCVTQVIRHSARGARSFLTQPPAPMRDDPRIVNYMRDVARAELVLETLGRDQGLATTIIYNSMLPPEPAEPTGNGGLVTDLTANVGITRSDLARITNTCILNEDCYGRMLNGIDKTLEQ